MRFPDLLIMSVNNLRRRKLRTALTVLGVIIGTASIVVMVSLGIGLNELTMEQIASWGSLTTIDVRSGDSYGQSYAVSIGGGSSGMSSGSKSEPNYITDEVIEKFSRLEHVTGTSPVLSINVLLRQGAYEAQYETIQGVGPAYFEQIKLGEGEYPQKGDTGLFFGNTVIQDFYNAKTGKGYWDTGELPDVDLMGRPFFVTFDMDGYYQSQYPSEDGAGTKPPKKYMMNGIGVQEGGLDDWNNYSYRIYMDVDGMKSQLKKAFKKGKTIPGQPTNKKGKPYNYFIYNSAQVYVDDVDNVTKVQKELADMGFQVQSQIDWLESSKQQSDMVQAVLGGIGAVSLFVAAIGIANTMMMSIYERTKEIGVMKVLGCDMGNIRNMFLIESGFIGFMGGVLGIGLSYGVSLLINKFVGAQALTGMAGDLSRVPPWLSLAAVAFAIFVGMAAGFMPAMRAMKLSPLAAIRNE
ncbi:ABC transporter permease [Clostridium sp. AF18-27]|uniref:ABC-type transport system, involved in lipoprotein release, permease component n=1 Tax=Enterocloster lavalensis TaxID=460384 RepID=A0A1I0AU50_9FIRM|nr:MULTISPECIES: ABC transporter permease [Enterocloster]MBS5607841.1 ABC transporter permease [Enterocloster asparagiformis]RHR49058.1 ABC transporter permease [Clostridium sp. AF18-27]MDR3757680.1 ABC transporter permease [Enterocloster sp.]PST32600.1 ABC transporter permease [Enterocloster lavalensis]SES97945.1 ABC-type transport system, involved in lipoprotein release, permease component [Enterocloster lavalensis]